MADDSMQAFMERLAREHRIEAMLHGTLSGGLGAATAAAPFISGGAGVAAMPALGILGAAAGSKAFDEWKAGKRASSGAQMWGQTGLPERASPETPEGDIARQQLLEALMKR